MQMYQTHVWQHLCTFEIWRGNEDEGCFGVTHKLTLDKWVVSSPPAPRVWVCDPARHQSPESRSRRCRWCGWGSTCGNYVWGWGEPRSASWRSHPQCRSTSSQCCSPVSPGACSGWTAFWGPQHVTRWWRSDLSDTTGCSCVPFTAGVLVMDKVLTVLVDGVVGQVHANVILKEETDQRSKSNK